MYQGVVCIGSMTGKNVKMCGLATNLNVIQIMAVSEHVGKIGWCSIVNKFGPDFHAPYSKKIIII